MKQYPILVVTFLSAFVLGIGAMWTYEHGGAFTSFAVSWPSHSLQTAPGDLANNHIIEKRPQAPSFGGSGSVGQMSQAPNALSPERTHDPFDQVERMRQQMDQMFGAVGPGGLFGRNDLPAFGSLFDKNFGLAGGGSLRVSEDDESITYSLDVPKENLSDLSVNVKDGYLSVDATVKQEANGAVYQSRFSQVLPMPASVDPNSLKVESGSETVVIHLDKQNA